MANVEESYEMHPKKINRRGRLLSAEINYVVTEAENEEDALIATYRKADKTINFADNDEKYELKLSSVEIVSKEGDSSFRTSVTYGKQENSNGNGYDDDDEPTMSFDCGGGMRHVTHAIAQKRLLGDLDAGLLIGWDGEPNGQVTGVDVPTAQLRETYTKIMGIDDITTEYKRSVAALVGKVNKSNFMGWDKGEAMFLGMSYSTPTSDAEEVSITYNFAIQLNEENPKIGNTTLSGTKEGFQYLWAISKTSVEKVEETPGGESGGDSSAASEEKEESDKLGLSKTMKAVFVAQVAEYGNFDALGL